MEEVTMQQTRPRVLLAFDARVRENYLAQADLDRLHALVDPQL